MNYEEWSNQYSLQATKIKKHIKVLKNQLKGKNASQSKDLNYRISLLYPMYLELRHTGKFLKSCKRREINAETHTIPR